MIQSRFKSNNDLDLPITAVLADMHAVPSDLRNYNCTARWLRKGNGFVITIAHKNYEI